MPIDPRDVADVRLRDAGLLARRSDVDTTEMVEQRVESVGVVGQPPLRQQTLLDEDLEEGRQEMRIAAGQRPQVDVCEVGRFRPTRIDHDQGSFGVVGDGLEDPARLREPVRLPGVLAPEHRHLRVLVVARGVAARPAEQLPVDPELAGLLLGERVRVVADTERRTERAAVPTTEMVALAAAAVEEDLVAAVFVDDVLEPRGHLRDRGVPRDLLEGPVVPAPQRGGETV